MIPIVAIPGDTFVTAEMVRAAGADRVAYRDALVNFLRSPAAGLQSILVPLDRGAYRLKNDFVDIVDVMPPYYEPLAIKPSEFGVLGEKKWLNLEPGDERMGGVWAYYFLTRMFTRLRDWGFDVHEYFKTDGKPIPVDTTVAIGTDEGDGRVINARVVPDATETRILRFEFALGQIDPDISIAVHERVVWHEFAHAMQIARLGNRHLGFTHSCGDALAAINCDLGPDVGDELRGLTFPFLPMPEPRRHDRDPKDGWNWGGPWDCAFLGSDPDGYLSEQILSTTLFNAYLGVLAMAGGADPTVVRRKVADYITYLVVNALRRFREPGLRAVGVRDFMDALLWADLRDNVPGPLVLENPAEKMGFGFATPHIKKAFGDQGLRN